MALRTPFKSNMERAVGDLKRDYSFYSEEFRMFFPDAIEFARKILL
jgi:acyl carrier protein phosphodiesterase